MSTANQGRGVDAAKAAAAGTWEPAFSSCAEIAPASGSDIGKEWEILARQHDADDRASTTQILD